MAFSCPRCGNTQLRFTFIHHGQRVCRRCLGFQGEQGENALGVEDAQYSLPFSLTPTQHTIAREIARISAQRDVVVEAVCGAGKTELVMEAIQERLAKGHRVGVAVARRQVALQLAIRFRSAFHGVNVGVVCEGHRENLNGALMVCTTHQLFRYPHAFDLLVLDEPDAFPFHGDPVLQGFAKLAVKGQTIYLTATPDRGLRQRINSGSLAHVTLDQRPHGKPLPIPKVWMMPKGVMGLVVLMWLFRRKRQALVFVPSVVQGKKLEQLLNIPLVFAGHPALDQRIKAFSQGQIKVLLTTTVLERGVTFKGIDVVVVGADHPVFTRPVLIQIAGRVGRDVKDPGGEVMFLCSTLSDGVKDGVHDLRQANRRAWSASMMSPRG
jgi:competence protein ComFA